MSKKAHTKSRLWKKQSGLCAYCLQPMIDDGAGRWEMPTIHHIIPRSMGGRNTVDNRVLTCLLCNRRVGNTIVEPKLMPVPPAPLAPIADEEDAFDDERYDYEF